MASDCLTQNEKSCLFDILFDGRLNFDGLEKKFKELFSTTRFSVVSNELKNVSRELIYSSDGAALITLLYIVDVMRKGECVSAKALLFDILVELEKAIRKGMFQLEQIKYTSKDASNTKKSLDAIYSDTLRMNCAAKVFIFELLRDGVTGATKAEVFMAMKQDSIDSALDAWEKSSITIKEPLADIMHCWTSDKEKQRCGAQLENGAIFDNQPLKRNAVAMRLASPKVPSLPVSAGELRYLLQGEQAFILFDAETPSPSWETAKKLIDSATRSPLSMASQHSLLDLLTVDVVKRMDFNDVTVRDIAQHNPEICAAIMTKLPTSVSSLCIQNLLTSNVSHESIETVFLHAPKSVEQLNLRTFITQRVNELNDKSGDTEALRSFSLCLHQLVTKASKENKELYIAEAVKPDLEQLMQSSGIPEIAARWDEMKS